MASARAALVVDVAAGDEPVEPTTKDGACMEPSARNRWQLAANPTAPKTAQTREHRCRGLPPLAAGMVRRGSTVRVRQRALQKRRTSALFRMCSVGVGLLRAWMEPFMELSRRERARCL